MVERFTENVRRVINAAGVAARARYSAWINDQDVLLGLLLVDADLAARLRLPSNVVGEMLNTLQGRRNEATDAANGSAPTLSQEAKYVLAYAAEEAERCTHKHIGVEHLLTGLVRAEAYFNGNLLKSHGIDLNLARRQLSKSVGDAAGSATTQGAPVSGNARMAASPSGPISDDLYEAARSGDITKVTTLLDSGINPNSRNTHGNTVLIGSALGSPSGDPSPFFRLDVVKLLLKKGADPNAKGEKGYFALMLATLKGRVDLVEVLLSHGADANLVADDGSTALAIAESNKFTEICKMLRRAGAA